MRFLIKKNQVELVDPPKSATVGERVTFPGFNGEPGSDDVLNPKKKVWETLEVDLNANTELVASYKDITITTSAGVVALFHLLPVGQSDRSLCSKKKKKNLLLLLFYFEKLFNY